jgi:cystathionine gamma-synthase
MSAQGTPRSGGHTATGQLSAATTVVAAGRPPSAPDVPMNPPIVLSSTYHAGGPVGYGRDGNPTWDALEHAIATLEGGRTLAFASGMAAVSAVLDDVPIGGVVVAPQAVYLGTHAQLRRLEAANRIALRIVDIGKTAAVVDAVAGADMLWIETPTNPLLEIADLATLIPAAHRQGARVVVDNTFATPLVQRPLEWGADVVVHSATKYLAGHADVILGLTVTRDEAWHTRLLTTRTLGGAIPGPVEAWLVLRGLRTLHVRLDRAQANANELAKRLARHPAVTRVRYPGLPTDPGHALADRQMSGYGAIVSIEVASGPQAAEQTCATTRLWTHATSLGGVESTLERRRRWPDETPAVPESLIRLSVGIEDVEDLWRDLDKALRSVQAGVPS